MGAAWAVSVSGLAKVKILGQWFLQKCWTEWYLRFCQLRSWFFLGHGSKDFASDVFWILVISIMCRKWKFFVVGGKICHFRVRWSRLLSFGSNVMQFRRTSEECMDRSFGDLWDRPSRHDML